MYFTGCIQISLTTVISIERYYILKRPTNIKKLNKRKAFYIIILCFIYSFFWSTVPLLGWSRYTLEDSMISCGVEYKDRSLNVISYNLAMFIFVFFIPLILISTTNIKSIIIVRFVFYISVT